LKKYLIELNLESLMELIQLRMNLYNITTMNCVIEFQVQLQYIIKNTHLIK
jgi:hypothetical protein